MMPDPPDVRAQAEQWADEIQAQVKDAGAAYFALMEATTEGPPLNASFRQGYDVGVAAGYLTTLETLVAKGILPTTGLNLDGGG